MGAVGCKLLGVGCEKEAAAVVEEQDAEHAAALAQEEQRISEAMAMTRGQKHAFTCWKVNGLSGGIWDKAWHVDDLNDTLQRDPGIYNADGERIDSRYSYTLCECMANDSAHPGGGKYSEDADGSDTYKWTIARDDKFENWDFAKSHCDNKDSEGFEPLYSGYVDGKRVKADKKNTRAFHGGVSEFNYARMLMNRRK